jgi:diacylglycerol kinase family enzyme
MKPYENRQNVVVAFLNTEAGTGRVDSVVQRLGERCASEDRRLELTVGSIGELPGALEAATRLGVDSVLVGGGDGTVSHAASLLVNRELALGILPLGTFNHFAKDAGIPLKLDEALSVAIDGPIERFDIGELNGQIFLNNSSLGLYPLIVRLREQHPMRGPAKWAIAAWAIWRKVRKPRELTVRLEVSGERAVHRTPIVMVSNNAYQIEGLDAASRQSLRDGVLAIYIVKGEARRHLLRLVWRIVRGRASDGELEVLTTGAATIEPGPPDAPVEVVVDGEIIRFQSPLEYRIRPRALRVRVPPGSAP